MSLGSLGGSRRRRSTNGVLGGAVSLGDACSDIADNPNSYDSSGGYTAAARAALATCGGPGPGSGTPTTTTSGGTSSSVPSAYWPDSRVKAVQNELDVLLAQAGCTTRMVAAGKTADGLIGGGTCGGIAWAKARGTPPATYARYASDFDRGCASFTLKAPACPVVSTTVSSALPFQVGVKNATALKWQYMLNTELQTRGLPTVPEDGVFNKATCSGFVAFSRSYFASHDPYPDDSFTAMLAQYSGAITQACAALAQAQPVVQAPPVTPPPPVAVDGKALMVQLQGVLNQALTRFGYNMIPVSGKWDAATCGAGAAVNPLLVLGDPMRAQVGNLTALVISALGKPCGVTIAGVTPSKPAAPVSTKPPVAPPPVKKKAPVVDVRSASLLPLNRDGECVINPGTKNAEIRVLQAQLNTTLTKSGYQPVPVTGIWDAATCGAMFELRGAFVPTPSYDCQNSYSVPLSCPAMTQPKKAYVPPKKQASMVVPLGIAAVLVTVGLVVAKKKGLIMAAKKGAVRA